MNDAKTALGLKIRGIKKEKGWSWGDVANRLGQSNGLDHGGLPGTDDDERGDGRQGAASCST